MSEEEVRKIARKELEELIHNAYDKGYYDGFADACDILAKSLTETISNTITEVKEAALECKAEVIKEEE